MRESIQSKLEKHRADYNQVQFWSGAQNTCTVPGCMAAAVTIPTSQTTTSVTINYSYDALYRLTAADYSDGTFFHYTYDAVGNRLTQQTQNSTNIYTYDAANRLMNVNGVAYTWDANGNLLTDGTNTYAYDSANRLVSVTGPSSSVSYAYDGLGNRLQETVNGQTTTYVVDLAAGLTQVLNDGTNDYLYGVDRLAQVNGSDMEYFLGDALVSMRQMTDSNGRVTLARNYDPYGTNISSVGGAPTIYGFTGEQQDSSTKLIDLRSRMLDPQTGRFLTKDTWQGDYNKPISLDGWLYGYANPVLYTDPRGHSALVYFTSDGKQNWTQQEKNVVETGARDVANAYANLINSSRFYMLQYDKCSGALYFALMNVTSDSIFLLIHGGPITFERTSEEVHSMGITVSKNHIRFRNHLVDVVDAVGHKTTIVQTNYLPQYPHIVVHEMGHAFDLATLGFTGTRISSSISITNLLRPVDINGIIIHQDPNDHSLYFGYAGGVGDWQFGWDGSQSQEEFADMFLGWTYSTWATGPHLYPAGSHFNDRGTVMNKLMLGSIVDILERYYHLPVRVGDVKDEPIWY